MSFLLEPDNYTSASPLFDGLSDHLAALNVLAGTLPGRVYGDDPAKPQSAVLLPPNRHRIYVAGEPAPYLLAEVMRLLASESQEGYGFVVYYDTARPWQPIIEQALQSYEGGSAWRQFYRLRAPSTPGLAPLPEQTTIRRIAEDMFADTALVNRDLLLEEVHSESPSLDYFFQHNFGFCAQDARQLVGWCLAEYHYQDRYELGIETIEAYQRRGIATSLADAVISEAFAQGATEIGWHCWAENTPSVATALRLGFEKALDYPVCYGQFSPAQT